MEKTRRDGKRKNRDKYFIYLFFSVGNRTMKKEKGSINRFTVKWKTHRQKKYFSLGNGTKKKDLQ